MPTLVSTVWGKESHSCPSYIFMNSSPQVLQSLGFTRGFDHSYSALTFQFLLRLWQGLCHPSLELAMQMRLASNSLTAAYHWLQDNENKGLYHRIQTQFIETGLLCVELAL